MYPISAKSYQDTTKRYEALIRRISTLSSLRKTINFSESEDLSPRQWSVIETTLYNAQSRLLSRLKNSGRKYLPNLSNTEFAIRFNAIMGKIDLDLAQYIIFFDTYLDLLSQRKITGMGKMLAGCDLIAWDAFIKNHPALSNLEQPIVSLQRGLGALIIRENVSFPGQIRNPIPLIQIPYSRFASKYDLTSIIHEVGHEVMVRLGLVHLLPRVFENAMAIIRPNKHLQSLFGLWSSEIGPDFWTFCSSGTAQATSIKELLSLPPSYVFHFSFMDPHPPPYLRVLLSFEWCRQKWGIGHWDYWEDEWLRLYPLKFAPKEARSTLQEAKSYLPIISKSLFWTKFKVLNGKRITDLFDMSNISPYNMRKVAESADFKDRILKINSPCVQLAAFRTVRDYNKITEEALDKIMTEWLTILGESKKKINL